MINTETRKRLPRIYPRGSALPWEQLIVKDDVMAYMNWKGGGPALSDDQVAAVADYLDYRIEEPNLRNETHFPMQYAALRAGAKVLETIEQIDAWLLRALDFGFDPIGMASGACTLKTTEAR